MPSPRRLSGGWAPCLSTTAEWSPAPTLASHLAPLDLFAALFAAAIHDFAHPGTNNGHEERRDSPLAVRFRYDSILESHHLASAFEALFTPGGAFNFVHAWARPDFKLFQQTVSRLVLMTDLSKHFEFIAMLEQNAASLLPPAWVQGTASGWSVEEPSTEWDPTLLLTAALKCADLGHSVKPWRLHEKWSLWVTEEFYALGDIERASGMPLSPFCDREAGWGANLAKNQMGFLTHVCRPLYVAVADAFSRNSMDVGSDAVDYLDSNVREWTRRMEL